MNKKAILAGAALLGLGAAYMFMKPKANNGSTTQGGGNTSFDQYEGKLLKTIPYNWRSSFVYGGRRYEITSDKAWSALNSIVGNLVGKTIELDINLVNQIPLGGRVSDNGELVNG